MDTSNPTQAISLINDQGTGRPFIILIEGRDYIEFASAAAAAISKRARVLLFETPTITADNWRELAANLITQLGVNSIRQASFVGFAAAAHLIQEVALLDMKSVRTIILVDPTSRPHPSFISRVIDRIEEYLPLGLPLRGERREFDGRALLQRIRCPALLVLSANASSLSRSDVPIMADRMPTCWMVELSNTSAVAEFADLALEFQEVPAKCPQRARAASSSEIVAQSAPQIN